MADRQAATDEVLSLVRQHYAALYRYAFRLSGNAADAEDLTQQAYLQALTHLDQVRERERVASWLYSILRRCFLRQVRQEKKQVELVDFDLEQLAETKEDMSFDGERLQNALAELPDEFRVVLLMFYFEELSYKQIATELDLPVGTVMSRLSRAKGHLRAKLLAAEANASKQSPASVGNQ
jgi:RNA polymerase sigma-70 factor (ECF subfamily)